MAWPFSKKKKVPRVPFPEGRVVDDSSLRFFEGSSDQAIIAENLKKAAGLGKDLHIEEPAPPKKTVKMPKMPLPILPRINKEPYKEPLYIKMDVYQRILGELDLLKTSLNNLSLANKALDTSEYNEETSFDKLKRSMKNLHDRLLEVDKILFKS